MIYSKTHLKVDARFGNGIPPVILYTLYVNLKLGREITAKNIYKYMYNV